MLKKLIIYHRKPSNLWNPMAAEGMFATRKQGAPLPVLSV